MQSLLLPLRTPLLTRAANVDVTAWWIKGIKLVLSLLILTILLALTGGVVKTLIDLKLLLNNPVEVALRQIIIDTLILLAVVEVFDIDLFFGRPGQSHFHRRYHSRRDAHGSHFRMVQGCPYRSVCNLGRHPPCVGRHPGAGCQIFSDTRRKRPRCAVTFLTRIHFTPP